MCVNMSYNTRLMNIELHEPAHDVLLFLYTHTQRCLRRDCASAQSRQRLHCSHLQSMRSDEGLNQNLFFKPHYTNASIDVLRMAACICVKYIYPTAWLICIYIYAITIRLVNDIIFTSVTHVNGWTF